MPELQQQIHQIIRTSADSPALLLDVANLLVEKLPGDVCLLVAGTGAAGTMAAIAYQGSQPSILLPKTLQQLLSDSRIESLFRQQQASVVQQLGVNPDRLDAIWEQIMSVRAFLGTATYFRNQSNGILLLGSSQPRQWSLWEKQLLDKTAESLAIAFSLVQLQEQANQNVAATPLTTSSRNLAIKAVDSDSHPILKVWYESTRQRTNTLIDNLITTMSDQTRNPLTNMKMAIQFLRQKNPPKEFQGKYLDILSHEWQKLDDINRKILAYQKLNADKIACYPSTVNLESLIDELVKDWEAKATSATPTLARDFQRLVPDSPLTLSTDAEHLTSILRELLANAAKFSLPRELVSLQIVEQTHPQPRITIIVSNPSPGFPPEDSKYFFDPFYRQQSVVDQGIAGIGLGLTIIKGLVQLLGGNIGVTCIPREGTEDSMVCFKLTLPN